METALDEERHDGPWQDLLGVSYCQRWVNAGGVSTRALEVGQRDAPPLIFLHGTGGHAEAFTRNLGRHSKHFHTYAIDMVGHGFTDKPAIGYELKDYAEHVLAFMDAEGLATASISGESLGADVVAWLLVHHGDRIDRAVLNTGGGFELDADVCHRVAELSMAAVRNPTREAVRARLEFLFAEPDTVTPDLLETRLRVYRQAGMVETMERILQRLVDPVIRARNVVTPEQWATVTQPVLVLWTSDDPTAPPERGRVLASQIPNSRFEVFERCAHWPQFEDPKRFDELHIGFLAS